jgi:hypothetical protein
MLASRFSRVATLAASTGKAATECEAASSVLRAVRRDIPATARQPCRTEPRSRLLPVTDHAPRSFHHAAFRYRPIRASAAWPDARSSPTHPTALIGFSNGPSQYCSREKMARRFRLAGPTCRLPRSSRPDLFSSGDRPPKQSIEGGAPVEDDNGSTSGFRSFPRGVPTAWPRERSCLGLLPLAGLRACPMHAAWRP